MEQESVLVLNFEETFGIFNESHQPSTLSPLGCWSAYMSYVIMQICLFIVCNHATEPNMPVFCPERQERRRKRKRKSDRCCCCHVEPEGTLLRMSRRVRSYHQAWPWCSLSPFSSTGLEGWVVCTDHGHAFFFTSLLHKYTQGERTRRKQSRVVKSSQVPHEDMDLGHYPWRDRERVRQLVTSNG